VIKHLNEQERMRLEKRVADAEKQTGAQVVLAVTEKSDSYAELPWKAFALGAAAAGLAIVLLGRLVPPLSTPPFDMLIAVTTTLVGGSVCALLCVALPGFARLFLDAHRAEVETRQYAESLFLSHEVFATRGRRGVLLLVSLFEQRVVVLPDTGLRRTLNAEALHGIIGRMTASLSGGNIGRALEAGLDSVQEVLGAGATGASGENELPNAIVQEDGP
jgi:putative membrane protein